MSSGKQWFTAKYRHQKPGQQSATTGSKQFFVYSHQEAIEQCRNELEAKYPGYIISVSRG
jgi:prephenate dehydratase